MPAPPSDDWSHPEIVRALESLTTAVQKLGDDVHQRFDSLDQRFVPRELYAEKHSHLVGRVDELGQRVVDVEAEQTRLRTHVDEAVTAVRRDMVAAVQSLRDATVQRWRTYVAPTVTGCVVALFVVIAGRFLGGS